MKFYYSAGINLKANREPWWSNGGRELWANVTREKNEEELPRWRKLVNYREKKAILAKAKRILGWRKSIIKFHTEKHLVGRILAAGFFAAREHYRKEGRK